MAGPRKSTSSSSAKRAKADEADQGDVIIQEPAVTDKPASVRCTSTIPKATFDHLVVIPLGELDLNTTSAPKTKQVLTGVPLADEWTFEFGVEPGRYGSGKQFTFALAASELKDPNVFELNVHASLWCSPYPRRSKLGEVNSYFFKDEGILNGSSSLSVNSSRGAVQCDLELQFSLSCTGSQVVFPGTLDLAKRISGLSGDPHPHNVRLSFPRSSGNLSLYANRDLLSNSSSYFKALFSSDFAEATQSPPSKRARLADDQKEDFEDSDDESDEVYAGKLDTTSTPVKDDFAAAFHEIEVQEATYTTYRAVLLYLQSGYIDFAPLRSASLPLNPKATTTRSDAIAEATGKDGTLPLPPSPKSVYRLAHFLGLTALQSLALQQIKSSLQVETAALELLTPTSLAYDEVQKVLIDYATQNIAKVEQTEAYKAMMNEIEEGGRPDAGPVLVKLLRAQRGR